MPRLTPITQGECSAGPLLPGQVRSLRPPRSSAGYVAGICRTPSGVYEAEIWSPHGSCILSGWYSTAQDAHDTIEAIMPGVVTHWHVAR
jgi:hypothetical protein